MPADAPPDREPERAATYVVDRASSSAPSREHLGRLPHDTDGRRVAEVEAR